jgi:predicted nucleic acid-binding protein
VPSEIVVDACTLLNVLATGRETEIASALRLHFVVGERAHDEVKTLRTLPDESGARAVVPADTSRLRAAGLLRLTTIEVIGGTDAFVNCAAHLRDEDAEAVALAVTLDLPLATDDGRERKIARQLYPQIELRSTLGLVRAFANHAGLDDVAVRELASDLRWRGNFLPPRGDPDAGWFVRALGAG